MFAHRDHRKRTDLQRGSITAIQFKFLVLAGTVIAAGLATRAFSQQQADAGYNPVIDRPAFAAAQGPLVAIDEAHFNFHTADGRYKPFAEVLRLDGFTVLGSKEPFSPQSLSAVDILVVANALSERNQSDWSLPTPSAFTQAEIQAVAEWIKQGGAFFWMVDHMPIPGAASELAAELGLEFSNGYAVYPGAQSPTLFSKQEETLKDHKILEGREAPERVTVVATFTGSAFRPLTDLSLFQPVLCFGPGAVSILTERAGRFNPDLPRIPIQGWWHAAAAEIGRGRVAIFGEAAMFSAQTSGNGGRMGMNHPEAGENLQLLLNTVRWLARVY